MAGGRASGTVGNIVRAGVREHVTLDDRITLDDADVFLDERLAHHPVRPEVGASGARGVLHPDDDVVGLGKPWAISVSMTDGYASLPGLVCEW